MTTEKKCSQCGERPVKPRYRRCARCRGAEFDSCACGDQKTKRAKACRTCTARLAVGPDHGSWKGGRTIRNSDGYVRIYQPGHPRAQNGRYVLEHILVMEEVLGRHLFPDENIHHRNGLRSDNRIENLELWSSAQPSGQRVEEKVAWMKEFIARYEGVCA